MRRDRFGSGPTDRSNVRDESLAQSEKSDADSATGRETFALPHFSMQRLRWGPERQSGRRWRPKAPTWTAPSERAETSPFPHWQERARSTHVSGRHVRVQKRNRSFDFERSFLRMARQPLDCAHTHVGPSFAIASTGVAWVGHPPPNRLMRRRFVVRRMAHLLFGR